MSHFTCGLGEEPTTTLYSCRVGTDFDVAPVQDVLRISGVLIKSYDDGQAMYAPDPLHARARTLRDLLTEHDREEVRQLADEFETRVEASDDTQDPLTEYHLTLLREAIDIYPRFADQYQ